MNACLVTGCAEEPKGRDAFCGAHWALLPRQWRVELVRLRNDSARGNRSAVERFLKAAAVAAHILVHG